MDEPDNRAHAFGPSPVRVLTRAHVPRVTCLHGRPFIAMSVCVLGTATCLPTAPFPSLSHSPPVQGLRPNAPVGHSGLVGLMKGLPVMWVGWSSMRCVSLDMPNLSSCRSAWHLLSTAMDSTNLAQYFDFR